MGDELKTKEEKECKIRILSDDEIFNMGDYKDEYDCCYGDFTLKEYILEGQNGISYVLNNRTVNEYKLSIFQKSKEEIKFRIISKSEYQIEGVVKLIENNFVEIETKEKEKIIIHLDEIDCRTIFPLSYNPIKYPNRYIPNQIREYIFKRDNYKCQLKLEGCTQTAEEIDHIIPVSKGGESIIENLQSSCFNCNRKKGNKY